MRVIGTAGHVDHGKSTLVSALTGINPDRLKEEQLREMTIDLGFAWLTLPDGEEVGIIDVPGHRDFIENMLAGVGGIDAVIFVIAADEGVMPQTKEHLAILDLLQIGSGIIVLTKKDLVSDSDWMHLVEDDVRTAVVGTFLEKAPMIKVSARSGEGIKELIGVLKDLLAEHPRRKDIGKPRLPVDRVFSIAGFGTVVTGTLLDGKLETGKEIEFLPSGRKGRIRGLQTHKRKEETAFPGSRVAVNISGIDVGEIKRGNVLCYPSQYKSTNRFDAHFKMLPDSSREIRHDDQLKIFLGAAESSARIRLIGKEIIHPGEDGWLQIETDVDLVAVREDHYILRRPSPAETVGGGIILNPHPGKRYKRFSKDIILQFETMFNGTPEDILYQTLLKMDLTTGEDLKKSVSLPEPEADLALSRLISSGRAVIIGNSNPETINKTTIAAVEKLQVLFEDASGIIGAYHQRYPLRLGIPKEEFKSRLKLPARSFNVLLNDWLEKQMLAEKDGKIRMAGREIQLNSKDKELSKTLLAEFQKFPYKPPSVKDCLNQTGEEIFNMMVEQDLLVQVSEDVVFLKEVYRDMTTYVVDFLKAHGAITVAQFRDHYDTSRKFALAFLEHLDAQKITIRTGDERKLFANIKK